MTFCFIIVAVSLLSGCGEKEAPPSPPSSREFEAAAKEYIKERNRREGTSFNPEDEAARLRQKYSNLPDDKKREMYDKVSR